MRTGRFDSIFYSRPVSYRSYNPRILRKEILNIKDIETTELLDFFNRNNVTVEDFGGLGRGIRFGDLLVERRVFNHNADLYYAGTEYVIRQWKPTNDLANYHPTGTHYVTKSFPELLNKLQQVLHSRGPTSI